MDVVSFFAGCGGLDLGFEQAGFRVVWANDLEPHCRDTYIRNHPNTKFVLGDMRKIDPNLIPECVGFIGGPPCQPWSIGGKQAGLEDERGQLFLKYIEFIDAKKPKFFVIENVKGLLNDKFSDVFEDFVKRLGAAGYDVHWKLLDAVNYRVPQNRERVFFVGFRKDLNVEFKFPVAASSEWVSLEKAIGDISSPPNFYTRKGEKEKNAINDRYPNHDVLASKFGSFYYRGNRRRGWSQPSFTINATAAFVPLHPSSPKMMCYGYEKWGFQKNELDKYRRLSVRECARIQTFPDSFVFEYDDIRDAYRMVGNSVPPRLGRIIAKSVFTALTNVGFQQNVDSQEKEKKEKTCILVGYYKDEEHLKLILHNMLYYVRSDGRKGSMFKKDCSLMAKYLLLHHKGNVKIYELEVEEPILTDALFLNTLGFKVTGDTYLCFKLKSISSHSVSKFGEFLTQFNYTKRKYSPYFITIDKVIY